MLLLLLGLALRAQGPDDQWSGEPVRRGRVAVDRCAPADAVEHPDQRTTARAWRSAVVTVVTVVPGVAARCRGTPGAGGGGNRPTGSLERTRRQCNRRHGNRNRGAGCGRGAAAGGGGWEGTADRGLGRAHAAPAFASASTSDRLYRRAPVSPGSWCAGLRECSGSAAQRLTLATLTPSIWAACAVVMRSACTIEHRCRFPQAGQATLRKKSLLRTCAILLNASY